MKRMLLILAVSLMAVSAMGAIPVDPEFSVLWGSFRCVTVVDSFLIASTDDGLMIAETNVTTGMYDQVNHLFLHSRPTKLKQYGDVLAVRTLSDVIYFVDIGNLPSVTLLGEVDPGQFYRDFALHGQDLYLCSGFDGVRRYALTQYTNAHFVDSSLLPIHAIQTEVRNDTLYVLDDYNGVLRFSLAGGFGQFAGIFWIPLQASTFVLADSTLVVGLAGSKQILVIHSDTSADTVTVLPAPHTLLAVDSLIAVLDPSSRVMDVINTKSLAVTHLPNEATLLSDGQAAVLTGQAPMSILYPDYTGTLTRYDLDDISAEPALKQVYSGPEIITDFEYFHDRLYVSQIGRPVDIFDVDPSGYLEFDTALFAPLHSATHLDQSMGRLLALFPPIGAVFLTRYEFDSLFLDNYLDVDTSKVKGFASNRFLANNRYTMVTYGSSRATLYALSDTLIIEPLGSMIVQGIITNAVVMREWVAVATNKGLLFIYRLNTANTLEHKATVNVPKDVATLTYDDLTKQLYAFSGDRVVTIDLGSPSLPVRLEQTPMDIVAVAIAENRLYAIGDEGMGAFERPQPGDIQFPTLLERGGRAGTMIKAISDLVFTSDGHALHVYDLRIPTETDEEPNVPSGLTLAPNYPNPFNPSTTIEYSLPAGGAVTLSVINLLGQEINRLVDELQPAGRHTVFWDGKTAEARTAATGIYFYRLVFNGRAETRKMLLLK